MARSPEQREYYLKNRDREIQRAVQWAKDNPERRREIEKKCVRKDPERYKRLNLNSTRLRLYGISSAEYDQILIDQDGKCKICREKCSTGKRLAVDHCHETKKIRGLLCSRCNTSIGKFEHNIALMQASIDYLKENSI